MFFYREIAATSNYEMCELENPQIFVSIQSINILFYVGKTDMFLFVDVVNIRKLLELNITLNHLSQRVIPVRASFNFSNISILIGYVNGFLLKNTVNEMGMYYRMQ